MLPFGRPGRQAARAPAGTLCAIFAKIFLKIIKKPLTKQSFFSIINVLNIFWGIIMNINLKEDIKPISYIKTNAADMINYINDH
jgi:hypothetical protein